MMKKSHPVPFLLLYLAVFAACAVSPYDRTVWWAENLPIMIIVVSLIGVYRFHPFSDTSCAFMSVLAIMHTIGGHYTFERVPFGFVTDLFGFERNHYDRIAHFSVGFYAYAIAELLLVRRLVRSVWILFLFPVFAIVAVAGLYEIFEWLYAVSSDEVAGIAVLGSQGDVWDAQKDILADTLGSLFSLSIFLLVYHRRFSELKSDETSS